MASEVSAASGMASFCKEMPVEATHHLDGQMDRIGDPFAQSAKDQMANNILNDILETAMDIADAKPPNLVAFADNAELENLIHNLSQISTDKCAVDASNTEPAAKQSANLGIGDSPPPKHLEDHHHHQQQQQQAQLVTAKPSKGVEKKLRVTDLVMNSKKALNNMLSEEQRRKQDVWEESNELVIQVIELQQGDQKVDVEPKECPLPAEDDLEEDLLMAAAEPNEQLMETIELSADCGSAAMVAKCGGGDEDAPAARKKSSLCSTAKKKKWGFSFKFFNFRKHRNAGKKTEEAVNAANVTSN